ncbi:ATP-dependent helicase [Dehalobacter sp. TBBPA1]|uniref:ATP-dependent helicase n=1 Tax=Dehalobacter sp. TBBPA1 TaxID=3235037 RepID=UPI0034A1233F
MSITLSDKQRQIVEFSGKNLLVIAGAGSGKTRVLTERIIKLISTLKRGEKVLAITFSNKATDELRERLIASLGEDKLNESAYIGTTHKFCLDLVTSRGSSLGLPDDLHICESYNDRLQIFKEALEIVPQFKARYLVEDAKENQRIIRELLDELSSAKRNLKFADDYSEDPIVQQLFEEYDNMLLMQGVIDFDDILRYAYRILTERESIARVYRKIYKHICVDEAQDLNKAQYEIIRAIAGDEIGVTMVGDPKQSIYGFNGSTSDYLENIFVKDFSAESIELNENFRSSKLVIEAANKIEKSFMTYGICKYDGEFNVFEFSNEDDEAQFIVDKIKYLVKNGHQDVENNKIELKQCAVIARNRYVFKFLEEKLKENNLEYTLKVSAKGSFSSESDLIKAFELGMRLLVNVKDQIHLKELSKLVSKNKSHSSFDVLRSDMNLDGTWSTLIGKLNEVWDILLKSESEIKFHQALKSLQLILDENQNTMDENEKLLAQEDIKLWKENWNSYIKKSKAGERTLSNFIRTVSLGSAYTPEDRGIVLTTVHMSKGLEYDVVFIMGLNEGVFPDYRAVNSQKYESDEKPLIEERHNMFVSITRSRRLCYVTYPLSKDTPWGTKYQKPSRFVHELNSNKID